ncbi:hypothetical protein [Streptomyces nigra]|uniref:hypothetical protein n=1 Tax=Streptomyces nigra TaxID=1827580 RepID=UPI0038165FFB
MDQGIAGVIAGVAGLIGAGIGGIATAYGARIGAQKTIEAAQTQVERQSAAEHMHWAREQRRQVYSQLIELHSTYMLTTITSGIVLDRGQALSDEELQAIRGQYIKFVEAGGRLDLWGPAEVVVKGNRLVQACGAKYTAICNWSSALEQGRGEDVPHCSVEFQAATAADKEARNEFACEARGVLGSAS